MVLRLEYGTGADSPPARSKAEREPADYRELIFRLALAISGEADSAEDIAQDTIVRLLRARGKLQAAGNVEAFVRTVTARCAINYLKRTKRQEPLPEDLPFEQASEDRLLVYQALSHLLPEQRALLGMAIGQGLSYREIAEALGIPEGTVASRLSAAKKAFQRRWPQ